MKKYVIFRVTNILNNSTLNPTNYQEYEAKEEAIEKIPKEEENNSQYLVVYKESDENGIIVKSKIVYIT